MQLVTYIFVFPLLLIAFKLSTGTAQLSFSSCPPVSVISDFNLSQVTFKNIPFTALNVLLKSLLLHSTWERGM